MREELIKLLEEAYESGIITSGVQSQIDDLRTKIKLSDAEYHKIEDRIRVEAFLHKVKGRKKKGETFIGDLRKQYKITDEDNALIEEELTREAPANSAEALSITEKPIVPAKTKADAVKSSGMQMPQSPPVKRGKPLVLVADDNESFLLLLSTIITKQGYECITTTSPETTIRIIMEKQPSLVLCDINFGIGKTTGLDVFMNIRQKNNNVPFIIISAFIQKEFKRQADKIGITGYIAKPIDKDQVLETIKKYIPA